MRPVLNRTRYVIAAANTAARCVCASRFVAVRNVAKPLPIPL